MFSASAPSFDKSRFIPGTVLAKRYRVTGLLGRGGMGEVYRADDLKLGQQVALKLLPPSLEQHQDRLDRFLNEVRLSLRVTHPNVCRAFDIGEVPAQDSGPAQQFLSMEYVDGEDLSTLLRRIGRLPEDKALEIARQICAGLAAAHEEGVLHRDLKPANIMIDGRGRAKITDFGLAGATRGIAGVEAQSGTPGYMAPEQIDGGELTERTDIYSLGLVLYEVFTGKRAFEATSAAEMAKAQQSSTPTSPSSHVGTLDPLIERVILRCLAANPGERPDSVKSVAAALPGVDPLAAAIAAGETPSPEMVAAAGSGEGLSPIRAWGLLGLVLATVAGALLLQAPRDGMNVIRPERPPAVLEDVARRLLDDLHPELEAVDHVTGFESDFFGVQWAHSNSAAEKAYHDALRELPIVDFWYRQSEQAIGGQAGIVYWGVPAFVHPGDARVRLDHQGRLLELGVVPPAMSADVESAVDAEPDWSFLFGAAGFDLDEFESVDPQTIPGNFATVRRAWRSTWPGMPEAPVHIEATALGGRPTSFHVYAPWQLDEGRIAGEDRRGGGINWWFALFVVAPLTVGGILARRNVRMGRGDPAGATVFAGVFLIIHFITWVVLRHHTPTYVTLDFLKTLGPDLMVSVGLWLMYMALEPMVRRRWPEIWVSWSRLISGKLRDPLVGRDILIGLTTAAVLNAIGAVPWYLAPAEIPELHVRGFNLGSFWSAFIAVLDRPIHAIQGALALLFVIMLLRIVLRRSVLVVAVISVALAILAGLSAPEPAIAIPVVFLMAAIWVGVITRFGFLAAGVAAGAVPLVAESSLNFGVWWGAPGAVPLAAILIVALAAFWASLGGRPVFGGEA